MTASSKKNRDSEEEGDAREGALRVWIGWEATKAVKQGADELRCPDQGGHEEGQGEADREFFECENKKSRRRGRR